MENEERVRKYETKALCATIMAAFMAYWFSTFAGTTSREVFGVFVGLDLVYWAVTLASMVLIDR